MSENSPRQPDPRAVRTRDRLGDALIGLLLAKPFNEITVQEVLDRAEVSRSTFYEHYRDKNDLFLSDVDDFFAAMSGLLAKTGERPGRVTPVTEFFTHVADARELYAALLASGRMHDVRELGEAHFARGIAERLPPSPDKQARAQALAGALFALLTWWVRQGMKDTPAQMDRLFHRMIVGDPGTRR